VLFGRNREAEAAKLSGKFWRADWEATGWLARNPGYVYGCMLVTFFLGASLFVLKAYLQLVG